MIVNLSLRLLYDPTGRNLLMDLDDADLLRRAAAWLRDDPDRAAMRA